jgi:pyruvate dehydrogenase E1 component alpha subunit
MREKHDPIEQLKDKLLGDELTDEAALKDIDRQIKEIVAEATEFAQVSPEPDAAELYTDILVEARA